jgi:hypothetical protein
MLSVLKATLVFCSYGEQDGKAKVFFEQIVDEQLFRSSTNFNYLNI